MVKKTTQKRTHTAQINLRLLPEHDELVRAAARHAGMTVTNWLRGLAVREARKELGR